MSARARINCPTCGQPVQVNTSAEGTSGYVGVAESALRELLGWQPHIQSALEHLHPQHRAAIERGREVVGDDIPF